MTVGKRVKDIRKKMNLSQAAFSVGLSVSQSAISQLEKDLTIPSGDLLKNMSIAYNININWLLTGKGEMFLPGECTDRTVSCPQASNPQTPDQDIANLKEDIAALEAENKKLNKELVECFRRLVKAQDLVIKNTP